MTSLGDIIRKEENLENFIKNCLKIYFETEIQNQVELNHDEIVVCLTNGTKAIVKIERA